MIHDTDISKIVVSSKFPFGKKGFKYFIGYKNGKQVRLLCVMLPKISAYGKAFDEATYMSFLIKNEELIGKYNEIWDKVSNSMKKGFDSEPAYNEKYTKTKIKSYDGKINTNFRGDKVLKEGSQYICLSKILIDSVFRTSKNYYPQVLLEESKLSKKKRCLDILLTVKKFLLMNLMMKILLKRIPKKKVLMKKIILKNKKKSFASVLFERAIYIKKRLIGLYSKHSPFLRISTRLKRF